MPTPQIDPQTGERIAAAAAPQIDPATGERISAASAKTETPSAGPLDRIAEWGARTFPHVTPADQKKESQDFGTILGPSADRFVSNAGSSMMRTLTGLPAAAADWVGGAKDIPNEILHPIDSMRQHYADNAAQPGKILQPGQAPPSPTAADASDYGADALGNLGAGLVVGGTAGKLMKIPGAAKDLLRGDVDASMAGTDITPRQRYTAAKSLGVNLPPAQATDSRLLKGVDWINSEGLLSAPMHERLQGKNLNALSDATEGALTRMSPFDPEEGGTTIQSPLRGGFVGLQNRTHDALGEMSPLTGTDAGADLQSRINGKQQALHDQAQQGYKDVAENYGDLPAFNHAQIVKTAEDIGQKNSRFSQQFPSLESRKVMGVVGDAAQLGNESQRAYMGPPTISDLMRSRSALLDLTRDPEIVKSSYDADIQRLIAAHDQSISDSLPEDGRETWRKANSDWESMKNTFDNPSSPYYHAARTPNPTTLLQGIGGTSPESIKQLRNITGDEGVGAVGRGVGENLLGRTSNGEYDLRNLGAPMQRIPEESRQALFGAQEEPLQGIGSAYREMQPFEKAANTENPEELVQGKNLGPQTAAGVRKLRDLPIQPQGAFGPAAPRIGEEGMGALRRGVATDLLGENSEGGFNFKQFPNNLKNLNEGYRDELFGPEGHQTLRDIGTTAKALDKDYNRSGSGKLGQKVIEFGKMATGVPLLQYPVGKFMTSPAASEWLMRPSKIPPALFAPGVGTATALSSRKRSENQ